MVPNQGMIIVCEFRLGGAAYIAYRLAMSRSRSIIERDFSLPNRTHTSLVGGSLIFVIGLSSAMHGVKCRAWLFLPYRSICVLVKYRKSPTATRC